MTHEAKGNKKRIMKESLKSKGKLEETHERRV